MTKEKVTVRINGSEYTLKGDGSEAYLYSIAGYVDKMLKDVLGSNPKHSNTSAAVLTALTVTDELFKTNQELNNAKKEMTIPREREANLAAKYKELEQGYKSINDENISLKEEIQKLKNRLKETEKANEVLTQDNKAIKTQSMEHLIEATTLKKEIKEFKESRLNN